jgi:hypothetical protein
MGGYVFGEGRQAGKRLQCCYTRSSRQIDAAAVSAPVGDLARVATGKVKRRAGVAEERGRAVKSQTARGRQERATRAMRICTARASSTHARGRGDGAHCCRGSGTCGGGQTEPVRRHVGQPSRINPPAAMPDRTPQPKTPTLQSPALPALPALPRFAPSSARGITLRAGGKTLAPKHGIPSQSRCAYVAIPGPWSLPW